MRIKTYRAKSMRDALALVRSELGPGASVLHTREAPRGPIARLLRAPEVEVAATADRLPENAVTHAAEEVASTSWTHTAAPDSATLVSRGSEASGFASTTPNHNDPTFGTTTQLIDAGIPPAMARSLVESVTSDLAPEQLSEADILDRRLVQKVEDLLPVCGPIDTSGTGCRVVALVGPTGVGKTTTLAKLAAGLRMNEGVRVGLITVDTYRVAAVEQLRTYADIIELPMEVVSTPHEMRKAVAKLADLDLVLIDTAGRSPRDETRLEELREMLAQAAPDEVQLVLSATTTPRVLNEVVDRFSRVGATSLLVTKLDEAPEAGHLLPVIHRAQMPVSYLTDGQGVPEDIRVAESAELARLVLNRGER